MNTERNERRARMLEKVRKLLAMGRDGRGNENEEETALRHANKIMAEFGISEAECDMAAITAGEMIFGEAKCGPDGRAPEPGKVYKSCPTYAGILAVGVARFTDSVVVRKTTAIGDTLIFQGERDDVLLARWIFGVLIDSIQREQRKSGWTGRGDANTFRVSASSALASRMRALAAERVKMYEEARATSQSRALVVVDHKHNEIVQRFGVQKTRSSRTGYRNSGAATAGSEAGHRINIPAGRPIGSTSNRQLA